MERGQRQFLDCRKLFGVGKISKMIESFDLIHRNLFMKFIMFEVDIRARDPVGGCLRLTENLQNKIVSVEAELQLFLHHLAVFRARVSHSTPRPSFDPCVQELPFQELQEQPQEQQFQPQEKDRHVLITICKNI